MRLEDGIHYRALTQILKCLLVLARKSKVQVFITTHSIPLVEGICEILGDEEYCKYRDATTWEWTPAILPNRVLDAGLNADWYGLLTSLFGTGKNRKTVANINVRNPELGGVVGNPIDKHGQPCGLTEEFAEVYRLHSLLPETIRIRKLGGEVEAVPFVETRQAGSTKLRAWVSMADRGRQKSSPRGSAFR